MKTWLITGTSTGLGKVLTEKLLAKGDRVVATVRKADALNELKENYPKSLRVAVLDVTDTAAIKAVVDQAFADLGQIDVVVNNAGYALFCSAEEASDEQIIHQINTNIIGSIQVIRAALPHFREQGHGRILQLSSAGGQTTYPNFSYYHTTKWAVEGFCDTIAKELAPLNIGVTIVEPGAHQTSFGSGMTTAPVMEAYENTPAGEVRRAVAAGTFPIKGDVDKSVQAMIDSVEISPAPLRLALGGDAYRDMRAALVSRLEALDAQKELALASEKND
ncbi:SDR family oxidoreductase [Mucilaginibacter sp. UR6-1]|uniref:SDR family oxidoreductase n=1 Tax=Mucilaginibacter sp. UR6-1 TaxID=1435643 RepID=UPI001E355A12|nr:SDR family oxidoreductase [Mucilaginibacter sp. UR6-1]MCC8409155.1 SDR family oxidoreductase [Mucilaginibacter sp. UR6-1]